MRPMPSRSVAACSRRKRRGLPSSGRTPVASRSSWRNQATGLVVPPSSPEALRSALQRILGDHELRTRLGRLRAGPEAVADFDVPRPATTPVGSPSYRGLAVSVSVEAPRPITHAGLCRRGDLTSPRYREVIYSRRFTARLNSDGLTARPSLGSRAGGRERSRSSSSRNDFGGERLALVQLDERQLR